MSNEKTLAEQVEEIREAVEDADYLVTRQDIDDLLSRIDELEAIAERLLDVVEEFASGHTVLIEDARQVLGGER